MSDSNLLKLPNTFFAPQLGCTNTHIVYGLLNLYISIVETLFYVLGSVIKGGRTSKSWEKGGPSKKGNSD